MWRKRGKDLSHGSIPEQGHTDFSVLQSGEWENGIHLVVFQHFFIHRQVNALHNCFLSSFCGQLEFLLNQVLNLKEGGGKKDGTEETSKRFWGQLLCRDDSCTTSDSCSLFPLLSLCSFFKAPYIQHFWVVRRRFTSKLREPEGSRSQVLSNQKSYFNPKWALPWWYHKHRRQK